MTDTSGANQTNTKPQDEGFVIDHDPNEKPIARQPKRTLSAKVGLALAAVIGIGAVVAAASGDNRSGWANDRWGHGWGGRFAEHRINSVLDDIDASDAQQDKIWAVIDRTRSQMRPIGREMFSARGEIATLLSAPTIDTAAIEKLRNERLNAVGDVSKAWVSAVVEAAQVLTAEQRAKLVEEIKDHGGRW